MTIHDSHLIIKQLPSHLRIFRHYVHLPMMLISVIEGFIALRRSVVRTDLCLPEYCKTYEFQESVVVMDERRFSRVTVRDVLRGHMLRDNI